MVFGLRIPGFIRIHFRYIRRSLITWVVLFIAPFIIGLMTLSMMTNHWAEVSLTGWQHFLIMLFLIALAFYFAERFRKFRRFYVIAIPAMVVLNGFFRFVILDGFSLGNFVAFSILAGFPAWILGRLSMGKGYRMLSDGADKDYRRGRDFYMEGDYTKAFVHLEPAAKRGHMKSLYLMGHAFEHGHGREQERVKAARLYDKAAKKGYRKAHGAFEALFETFSAEEARAFEVKFSVTEGKEIF